MTEIRCIGRYIPSEYTSDTIEIEFRRLPFLSDCCRRERISVRIPEGIPPHADNMEWHQDGGGPLGNTKHMVIWASEMPTELRDSSGVVYEANPHDIIWFDNYRAFHRQPRDTRADKRWFVSIRCSGELI